MARELAIWACRAERDEWGGEAQVKAGEEGKGQGMGEGPSAQAEPRPGEGRRRRRQPNCRRRCRSRMGCKSMFLTSAQGRLRSAQASRSSSVHVTAM